MCQWGKLLDADARICTPTRSTQERIITRMSWLLYVCIAVVSFVTLGLLERTIAVETKFPRATGLFFNSMAVLCTALIYTLSHKTLPTLTAIPPQAWLLLAIAITCYGLFERGRFTAAKLLEASTFSVVVNVAVIVSMIGSFLFYQEPITAAKLLGSTLIIGSLFLVGYQKTDHPVSREGLLVGIAISTALGIGWMLDKKGTEVFGSDLYGLFIWMLPLGIIIFPKVPLEELRAVLRHKPAATMLMALVNSIGYLAQLKAFELADATLVIPLVQTSLLLTVLAAIFVLKERSHIPQKIVSGVLALAGVLLIVR